MLKSANRREASRACYLEYDFSESWFSRGHGLGHTQQATLHQQRAPASDTRAAYSIHVIRLATWVSEDDRVQPVIIQSCGLRNVLSENFPIIISQLI